MEFPGHVGAALAAYAPVAFVALRLGQTRLALAGAAATVALASSPDVDLHGPRLNHRGYTHTVWFAGIVGVGCGAATAVLGDRLVGSPGAGPGALGFGLDGFQFGPGALGVGLGVPGLGLGAFGFLVGAIAILSHVAADSLTPMGVAPFAPLWRRRFSLGLTRSADPVANRRLLLGGLAMFALAAGLGTVLAPPAG